MPVVSLTIGSYEPFAIRHSNADELEPVGHAFIGLAKEASTARAASPDPAEPDINVQFDSAAAHIASMGNAWDHTGLPSSCS